MLLCQNNSNNFYTERKAIHELYGLTIFTSCSFDKAKSKLDYCIGKDCIKELCKKLKDHALKTTNYEKKEMIPLSEEENKSYEEQDVCHIRRKKLNSDKKDKKHQKVKDHCHYTGKFGGAAHDNCNLRYKIPKEIPVVFHNGSTYNFHFIITQLAEEFNGRFECIGENMEKYITFSLPVKKECDNGKMIR